MNKLTVEVEIVEARDLLASDSNGFSDPYVIIDPTEGHPSSSKTPIIKKTLNPVWNYKTVLAVDPNFKKLKFRVFDWDRFSRDDPLGCCSFPSSMFADGIPLDVWEPLKQKPKKKSKDPKNKGPYPTKGELHVRISIKAPPTPQVAPVAAGGPMVIPAGYQPQACQVGDWYVLRSAVPGDCAKMVQTTQDDFGSATPFLDKVSLGLGWDVTGGRSIDLDASVIAFDAHNNRAGIFYFGNKSGFGGAIQHCGDNTSGEGEGDDEVINLDLAKIPPHVCRLACVVNSYRKDKLSCVSNAYVRLFMGNHTLGVQNLTSLYDSIGLFFCFLQRNATGAWFFQTVAKPISGNTANESLDDVIKILSTIPVF